MRVEVHRPNSILRDIDRFIVPLLGPTKQIAIGDLVRKSLEQTAGIQTTPRPGQNPRGTTHRGGGAAMSKELVPSDSLNPAKGQFLVYEAEDGRVKIDVRLD